jgi:hypothetical protein
MATPKGLAVPACASILGLPLAMSNPLSVKIDTLHLSP